MSGHEDNPPGAGTASGGAEGPRRLLDDPYIEGKGSAAWAVALLRGAAPYRAPAGRKQRVQLRLGHTPRPHAPLLLRLAVMGVVLFGFAAIVSAALGRWPDWAARAYERVAGTPPTGAARSSKSAHARAVRREEPPATSAIDPPAIEVQSEAPAAAQPVHRPSRDAMVRPRRTAAAVAPAAGEDASAVSAAMRALRVERNPARARALLARYLGEHPNGSLAEEALAMSIEAAIAHHDADVASLAARYLRLYPRGSFQALARQALESRL
jgi:hypothetical protein